MDWKVLHKYWLSWNALWKLFDSECKAQWNGSRAKKNSWWIENSHPFTYFEYKPNITLRSQECRLNSCSHYFITEEVLTVFISSYRIEKIWFNLLWTRRRSLTETIFILSIHFQYYAIPPQFVGFISILLYLVTFSVNRPYNKNKTILVRKVGEKERNKQQQQPQFDTKVSNGTASFWNHALCLTIKKCSCIMHGFYLSDYYK